MRPLFVDRAHAGRVLAGSLADYANEPDVLVLGLARGGVPVAYEVAKALGAELDVLIVRKLGAPANPELAIGALASGGGRVLNQEIVDALGITTEQIEHVEAEEAAELKRREVLYRGGHPPLRVAGRTVILVDDGLATGATMRAALQALRNAGPKALIAAVPVGPGHADDLLLQGADHVVCPARPERFQAVGQWYERFDQTSDDEVRHLLNESWEEAAAGGGQ